MELEEKVFEQVLKDSGKEAIDLYEHEQRFLSCSEKFWDIENKNNSSWAIYGCPREEAQHDSHRILHSKHDGIFLSGGLYRLEHVLKYAISPYEGTSVDTCTHQLGSTKDLLPSNFAGVSGGGVWQIGFKSLEELDEDLFVGILVNRTVCEDSHSLVSRGPVALYEVFTPYLRSVLGT